MLNAIHRARVRWLSHRCPVCGLHDAAPARALCDDCAMDYFADVPRCAVCALRLPIGVRRSGESVAPLCAGCATTARAFDATLACADYALPFDGMVIALKFGHRLDLARTFGLLLSQRARADERILADADAIIAPVPLAFDRLSERGFNQAREIARVVAAELDRPLEAGLLLRIRHGAPQERLDLEARRRNVRGAFTVRREVADRHVLVVDDVMTSGATLDEIAAVLKRAGARRVTNLIVARTP